MGTRGRTVLLCPKEVSYERKRRQRKHIGLRSQIRATPGRTHLQLGTQGTLEALRPPTRFCRVQPAGGSAVPVPYELCPASTPGRFGDVPLPLPGQLLLWESGFHSAGLCGEHSQHVSSQTPLTAQELRRGRTPLRIHDCFCVPPRPQPPKGFHSASSAFQGP